MTTKELGKIQSLSFGTDSDGRFGFHFTLGGPGWGTNDFWGVYDKPGNFTEKLLEAVVEVRKLLFDANTHTFDELLNCPIEVTFSDGTLMSWRILTEVL